MRYMEVYPNSTTIVLTSVAVTRDCEVQPDSEALKDSSETNANYQRTCSVDTSSMASHNTDVALLCSCCVGRRIRGDM